MAKQRTERQERKAAEREAAERRKQRTAHRSAIVWRTILVVVVLAAAVFGYRQYAKRRLLAAVTTANYAAGMHVAGPITYKETPPMGGPHNVVWQNCGVYNAPIHNEHAVHSMEHGTVWITYRLDLPVDQVQTLRGLVTDDYMLLSPYPGLPSPVVASAWNHQVKLDGANDPRLKAFIDEYKNNPTNTPEFGAPCAGGIGTTADVDTLRNVPGGMVR